MSEGGVDFVRATGNGGAPAATARFNIATNPVTIYTGASHYMVLKVRTNFTDFQFFNVVAATAVNADSGIVLTSAITAANGEWITIVIDLVPCYSDKGFTATDGAYPNITKLQLLLQGNSAADDTKYVDVAFAAICDSLEDVVAVVDQETVAFFETSRTSGTFTTKNVADLVPQPQ
jgi:hypothetical protein